MTKPVNLTRGMKVTVRRKGQYYSTAYDWFPATVDHVEIEKDGEEYVVLKLAKAEPGIGFGVRVNRDDVKP